MESVINVYNTFKLYATSLYKRLMSGVNGMNRENELLSWTMWEYIFEPLYFLLRGQLCFVMEGFIEVAEYSHDIEWALGTDREKTFISKTNWPLCYTFFVLSMRVFCMTRKSFMPRRYKWFLMVLAAFHFSTFIL